MKYTFNLLGWSLLPAIVLAFSAPTLSDATAYKLAFVAKTGDVISGRTLTGFKLPSLGPNAPAINANGTVAFYATYSQAGLVGEGIFTRSSLVIKTGDTVSSQTLDGISFVPATNDRGTVAVRGLLSSQSSAIVTSTAVSVKTGDVIGGQTLSSIGVPAINNNGTLAFVGSFSTGSGIFTQRALLARTGGWLAGQTPVTFGPPAINDPGTVAFQSWFSGKITTAIVTPTQRLVKTGDTISGKKLTDLFFSGALNSSGTVAFVGVFSDGTGVFTQRALVVQAGDKLGGQTLMSFGSPVISDSGTVAFFATYQGGEGIFTQTAPIAKTGDTICGRTLVSVGPPAISKVGLLVFTALFSDRSSAIVMGRPTRLEPGHRGFAPRKRSRRYCWGA